MEASREQIAVMMIRRGKFKTRLEALEKLIVGTSEPISAILGRNEEAHDEEARKFALDVANAYSAYLGYLHSTSWNEMYEEELTWDESYDYDNLWSFGREQIAEKGNPMRLDGKQLELVTSAISCFALLAAHWPDSSHTATIEDVKNMCQVFFARFAQDGYRDELWSNHIDGYVLADGNPRACTAERLAQRVIERPEKYPFPSLGVSSLQSGDDILVADIRCMFEMLSGKPFSSLIPPQTRNAIMADKGYASREELERSLQDGMGVEMIEYGVEDFLDPLQHIINPNVQYARSTDWYRAELDYESEHLAEWAEGFTCKREWCEHYTSMYEAFFALNGIDPTRSAPVEGDPQDYRDLYDQDAWVAPDRLAISALIDAIDIVLDARGIAHYSDDVFMAAYEGIQRSTVRAKRLKVQGH